MQVQRSARLDEPVAGVAGWRPVIRITAQMRVLVVVEPVDGRRGIDSLVRLCQDKLDCRADRLAQPEDRNFHAEDQGDMHPVSIYRALLLAREIFQPWGLLEEAGRTGCHVAPSS